MAYGTLEHVAIRLLRPFNNPVEENLAMLLLDDVERLIRRRIPDLDDQVTDGSVDLADLQAIESGAVADVLRNPDNLVEETDGNYSYRREATSNQLSITAEQWEILGYVVAKGVYTIAPRADLPWEDRTRWDPLWWQKYGEWWS